MPELPELEVVRDVLEHRVIGQGITSVKVVPPGGAIVVRDLTHTGIESALTGATITAVARRGKFIVLSFGAPGEGLYLAINPKLTGRVQLSRTAEKLFPNTHLVWSLADGSRLSYFDRKKMGQLYLTHDLQAVPDYAGMGPEPLEISLDEFRARIKRFQGEIKGVLTRGELVAGIGNAYADEILWAACLHPFRKRTQLTPAEIERLYEAMRTTLSESIDKIRAGMGENIHLEPRGFFAVHLKTGQPCPRCGTPISLIGANDRITNFCRNCQPGGLIKGMA
jgi:formamidopyrimidine-DNA glycosylase